MPTGALRKTRGIHTKNSFLSIRERGKSGQRERAARSAQSGKKTCGDSRPFGKLRAGSRLSGRAQLDSLLVVMGKPSHYRAAGAAIAALALH